MRCGGDGGLFSTSRKYSPCFGVSRYATRLGTITGRRVATLTPMLVRTISVYKLKKRVAYQNMVQCACIFNILCIRYYRMSNSQQTHYSP